MILLSIAQIVVRDDNAGHRDNEYPQDGQEVFKILVHTDSSHSGTDQSDDDGQPDTGDLDDPIQHIGHPKYTGIKVVVVSGPLADDQAQRAQDPHVQVFYHHLHDVPVMEGVGEKRTAKQNGNKAPYIAKRQSQQTVLFASGKTADVADDGDSAGVAAYYDGMPIGKVMGAPMGPEAMISPAGTKEKVFHTATTHSRIRMGKLNLLNFSMALKPKIAVVAMARPPRMVKTMVGVSNPHPTRRIDETVLPNKSD